MEEKIYGHKKMIVWQVADELDAFAQRIFDKIPKTAYKLREQLDSASDSVCSNFVEGYYSDSISEYIRFCKYSKRSAAEVQHRVRRVLKKRYITRDEFQQADQLSGRTIYLFDRLIKSLENRKLKDKNTNKNSKQ